MKHDPPSDPIARLVAFGGGRAPADSARIERIREAVRPRWRRQVRVRHATRAGLVLAAGLLLATLAVPWLRQPIDPETATENTRKGAGEILARVEAVVGGGVRWLDGDARGALLAVGDPIRPGSAFGTSSARAALALAGGVSVRIDRDTRLRLLGPGRLELLVGAIYVDTERPIKGPPAEVPASVEVVTAFGVVEDIGTRFEVRLAPEALSVRVRDGVVVLHHGRGDYEGRGGEELRLGADATLARAEIDIAGPEWDWQEAVAVAPPLDGVRLDAYLEWVVRETGVTVRWRSSVEPAKRLTGVVHGDVAGLPVWETLDIVLPVAGLEYHSRGGELLIGPASARDED